MTAPNGEGAGAQGIREAAQKAVDAWNAWAVTDFIDPSEWWQDEMSNLEDALAALSPVQGSPAQPGKAFGTVPHQPKEPFPERLKGLASPPVDLGLRAEVAFDKDVNGWLVTIYQPSGFDTVFSATETNARELARRINLGPGQGVRR